MMMDQLTLPAHILAGAAAHDGCPLTFASSQGELSTTLGALVSEAERLAGALQARGIGPGDVVAVQLPGSYEGAVTQVAVALCGAVLLPVVMIYGPREMDLILDRAGAAALFVPREYRGRPHAATLLGGLASLPALKLAVVVGDSAPGSAIDNSAIDNSAIDNSALNNTGAIGFTELRGGRGGAYRQPHPDPDDRAVLMYTSGTTAEPKGVQHSHRTLLAEVPAQVYTYNGPGALHLGLFPPGHMAGLNSLLRSLLRGTPTIIMQAWDAALAAQLIDRHQVTSSVGAPVQLAGLLDQQAAGTATLASLREFLTGAAPVPPALVRRADAAGVPAFRSYGLSEHPTICTGTCDDPLVKRAETDGRLLAGDEVRIVDARGNDRPAGQDGEILSRGPELFLGYTDPALNATAFAPGGWFRTGDVGRLDSDGYLVVTDRLKDIIIRGGENISAKEVEDLLFTHPAVAEVAVIPTPDPALGERVCAVVVTRTGSSFDVDAARAHFAAAGAAKQKTPERIMVVDELPRTPSGKVRKDVLRAQAAGQQKATS